MMVKPTVQELLTKVDGNRFKLVIATSKRARQLASGSEALTDKEEASPVSLAADEIAEGKVSIVRENNANEEVENGNVENENIENTEDTIKE